MLQSPQPQITGGCHRSDYIRRNRSYGLPPISQRKLSPAIFLDERQQPLFQVQMHVRRRIPFLKIVPLHTMLSKRRLAKIFPFSISKGVGMSSAPTPAIINVATVRTVHRRGKSMSRRTGQNGTVEERNGAWRGRFLVDIPGQMERQKRSVILGFKKDMTKSEARRKLKEIPQL